MKIGWETGRLGGTILEFKGAGLPRGLCGGIPRFFYGCGGPGNFRAFIELNDTGIGDLPTEGLYIALLLVALFQKDGLAGVGGKVAGGGQDDISSAVSHHDPPT